MVSRAKLREPAAPGHSESCKLALQNPPIPPAQSGLKWIAARFTGRPGGWLSVCSDMNIEINPDGVMASPGFYRLRVMLKWK